MEQIRIICIIRIYSLAQYKANNMVTITSVEFQRNIGQYQDTALTEPVSITRHGRERLVLISAEEFHLLQQRAREVLHVNELTEEDIALLESTQMSKEHNHLNTELNK